MSGKLLHVLRNARALARPGEFGLKPASCPICGPTLMVKLADEAIAVRCLRCRASTIHMGLVRVVAQTYADLAGLAIYEMSSRGPVFAYLRARSGQFTCSEYYDDVPPGESREGVRCQNVERLTYPDASFDLCTSTEVFEHVADDQQGFREILRVLRPGGRLIFTVPFTDAPRTVERARLVGGEVRHMLPPEYHGDAIRGQGRVLCIRNYGADILERLLGCGFDAARIEHADVVPWPGFTQRVIVAEKR